MKEKKRNLKNAENVQKGISGILLLLPGILVALPVLLLITGSLMDQYELKELLGPIFQESGAGEAFSFINWRLIPDYPYFGNYKKLLLLSPQFFVLFWNSMKMVLYILTGQMLVGVSAAWAFAVYQNRFGKLLFTLYVVLMLLPFQVTMLSSYLVLNGLSLLNTQQAVILPAMFSTFPVFLCYGGFRGIPIQLFEAARVDGATEFFLFFKIGLPLGKSGILSTLVLGFLEYWNMMEQPMAFLDDKALWPLSLYLPEITWERAGFAFCASIITLVPAAFVFILGQDYLEQGIIYSGLKE